jgi:positive regulator of sigma E activity
MTMVLSPLAGMLGGTVAMVLLQSIGTSEPVQLVGATIVVVLSFIAWELSPLPNHNRVVTTND